MLISDVFAAHFKLSQAGHAQPTLFMAPDKFSLFMSRQAHFLASASPDLPIYLPVCLTKFICLSPFKFLLFQDMWTFCSCCSAVKTSLSLTLVSCLSVQCLGIKHHPNSSLQKLNRSSEYAYVVFPPKFATRVVPKHLGQMKRYAAKFCIYRQQKILYLIIYLITWGITNCQKLNYLQVCNPSLTSRGNFYQPLIRGAQHFLRCNKYLQQGPEGFTL